MSLADWMEQQMRARPVPAGVEALSRDILARHGESVLAVVFYGSCRRKNDAGEGLADLLVLVDSYQGVHGVRPIALANWVLPPNVYYLETVAALRRIPPNPPSHAKGGIDSPPPSGEGENNAPVGGEDAPPFACEGGSGGMPSEAQAMSQWRLCEAKKPLASAVKRVRKYRSKYAMITLTAFEHRCRRGLDGYFWARFAQPAQLAFARDNTIVRRIATARANAASRFATRAAGLFDGELSGRSFWIRALQASYRCELRPERPEAAERLIEADADYYTQLAEHLLPALAHAETHDGRYRFSPSASRRLRARGEWWLRRIWGKTLNLARLFKAAGTFSGGIDYLLWKVERHSGVHVEPTAFMRRHPRLAAAGLAWKLKRQGGFK